MDLHLALRLYRYDPETGIVTWRVGNGRSVKSGDRAGCVDPVSGYRKVGYRGKQTPEHRLAWLMHYGEEPSDDIDHINRVRADNRICNLRLATKAENNRNKSATVKNKSGVPGVYWSAEHKKWKAQISINGKRVFLGLHDQLSDAARAKRDAEIKHFGKYRNADNDNDLMSLSA